MNHPPRIRVVGSVSFFPFPSAIVLIRNGMRSSSSKLPWLLETGSPTVRTDRWRSARTRPLPVVAQISARLVRGRVVLARISGSRRPDPTPALTGRPMAVRLKRELHRSGMAGGRGARQKHQAKADPGRVLPVVPFPDRSGAAYRVAGCRGGLARAYCRYLAECCGCACGSGSCKISFGRENGARRSRKSRSSSRGELPKNAAVGVSIQIWSAYANMSCGVSATPSPSRSKPWSLSR